MTAKPTRLLASVRELAWQERAVCAQTDPEAFFPEKGGTTREAKKVCRSCDVRAACLQYALDHDERFGIWGGMSERQRRKLKRQQRESQATPPEKTCISCGDTKPLDQFPARTNEAEHGFCVVCAAARRHRITVSQLEQIKARRETGETLTAIAEDYDVTHGYLSKLLAGHSTPAPDPVVNTSRPGTSETGKVAA